MNRQQLMEVVEIFKEISVHSSPHERREATAKLKGFLQFTQPSPSQADAICNHLAGISLSPKDPESQVPAILALIERAPLRALEIQRQAFRFWFDAALEIHEVNPGSTDLIAYHRALTAIHFSPYWLRFSVARLWILSGKPEPRQEAIAMCKGLLQLSPRDRQYLEGCIEIADLAGDGEWLSRLREQVLKWKETFPYKLTYLKLEKRLNEIQTQATPQGEHT